MPLFRHPVRPLTETGRVLLCVALSLLAALMLMLSPPAHADDSEATKAESPYFFVHSDDPGTDRLPLKSTTVDVRIAGVIADVTVTQHYRNEGQRAIEARYVFPGSTRAAVHAMTVRLGDRLLTAKIKEKQAARIEYDTAKKEGKTSALLEQHRPNVFQMNVANILPGDEVAVELRYTELLTPHEAQYGFVFPTVVGPRYNSPRGEAAAQKWVATPYLPGGTPSPAAFDLKVTLDAPVALKEITSPSHDIGVSGAGTPQASVSLLRGDERPLDNRDFILNYRLAGDRIESGLMLYRGEEENFFLALVEPPKAVPARQINPRDYIFVVDISGSMHGYPLETAKALLQELIGGLRPSDTFNVMLFAGSSRMLSPASVPATRANIDRALRTIRESGGGGSTEIVPALRRIVALPKAADVSRSVIVVTDGYVTVEREVFQLIAQNLNRTNVFAFGIGSSVNRHLIEGIARAGQGEAFVVTKPDQAAAQAERLRRMIDSPVLTQVKARFEGLDVYDVEPAQLPDVLGGRPVMVIGKWRGDAGLPASGKLVVEGRSAEGAYRQDVAVDGRENQTSGALRHLWARQRIAELSDQEALEGGDARKTRITELGLRYSLLTQYTSFIAVDQRVRNPNPALAPSVDQPSPLPEGVSPLAIGAEVPGTPEPAAWLALLVVIAIVAATVVSNRRRR
ncbi:VIT and vWA domain-containing protein [Piscinibacter sp.]|uniref:VIT and vWA domain-containing protein n=1 Tax=Piscinibacter sp. TaxID=1903157 RepID=UPI002B522031|nr:VIT domain-containing protein [Albitalea sp.]HUG25774.1 VIT domain-containing protein [Albitalea sp.]